MALSMSKKKSRLARKEERKEFSIGNTICFKIVSKIPTATLLFLLIIFLWSSSTTIISGNIVHVCISSRKLNNLYCLSAGTQPNFEIPVSSINTTATSSVSTATSPMIGTERANSDGNEEVVSISRVKTTVATTTTTSPLLITERTNGDRDEEAVPISSINTDVAAAAAITSPMILTERTNSDRNEEVASISSITTAAAATSPIVVTERTDRDEEVYLISSINTAAAAAASNSSSLIVTERINRDRNEEVENAKKVVEEQMQLHRSWISNTQPGVCDGRGIYIYDLPSKFNQDLVGQCEHMIPWKDLCNYFKNEAFGEPIVQLGKGWYETHQYSLELIFHSRILKHPCRVYNENEAKLFYIPYYGGLDILRWHFKNVSNDVKDILALELIKWLQPKKSWIRNSGKDHVFVLGKIAWDFRRSFDSSWGTRFLQLEEMQNPIKLLIERQPWEENDIGIPHPTYFHPHSDDDIETWQLKIIQTTKKIPVSFAGAARPDQPGSIRSRLIDQCITATNENCKFLNCSSGGCGQPETIIELFVESEFCLQPPGDSPTRKSVFDSLISGCIPVIFDPYTAYYQYPWHLPEEHGKYSVFIDQEEVREMKVNVVEKLMKIPEKERQDMRRYIVYELLPRIVYGDSNSELHKFQDAFSITINNLLERVNRL